MILIKAEPVLCVCSGTNYYLNLRNVYNLELYFSQWLKNTSNTVEPGLSELMWVEGVQIIENWAQYC